MLNITDHSFISSIIKCIYIITYVEKCRELPKSVNTTLGSRIIYEEMIIVIVIIVIMIKLSRR